MRYLLTGATGFLGKAVVGRLLAEGHDVMAWVRDPNKARELLGERVEITESLETAVAGVDVVVNLAGEPVAPARWTPTKKERVRASRVNLTRRLVLALAAADSHATLVSASAVGIYGDRGDEWLDESSAAGTGFLAQVVRDWEAEAVNHESRGRVVRLRFGLVLGEGGGLWATLRPVFAAGVGGPIGSGKQYVPWVHLHDVVEVILRASRDESWSGAYDVVAPEPVPMNELAKVVAGRLRRPGFLRVPTFALKLALGEAASAVLGGQRVRPARLEAAGYQFRFPRLPEAVANLVQS